MRSLTRNGLIQDFGHVVRSEEDVASDAQDAEDVIRKLAEAKMFANGAPAHVQTLGTVALGRIIAAREVAHLPDGKVLDEISYEIEKGSILRDWFIFNEPHR